MNLRVNDNKIEKVIGQTVNGLNIAVLLEGKTANTTVADTGYQTTTGFDPSQINLQVDLKRNGKMFNIVNNNLALLAVEATIMQGGHLWFKGLPVQAPAAGKTHIVKRSLFLYFKGHINISGDDELIVNCTVNRGSFGSDINENTATLQIEPNQSIGIEYQLNKLNIHSITAELNQDRVSLGDNVTDIVLHSFESDWNKPVFRQVSLGSDRLDWTFNDQQLPIRHFSLFPHEVTDILLSQTAVGAHPLRFPNSFKVHQKDEVDKATLQFTMNSANVQPTRNFVFYWTFETSREMIAKAAEMKDKHDVKNIDKVPLSI